jgi:hypothetical protein
MRALRCVGGSRAGGRGAACRAVRAARCAAARRGTTRAMPAPHCARPAATGAPPRAARRSRAHRAAHRAARSPPAPAGTTVARARRRRQDAAAPLGGSSSGGGAAVAVADDDDSDADEPVGARGRRGGEAGRPAVARLTGPPSDAPWPGRRARRRLRRAGSPADPAPRPAPLPPPSPCPRDPDRSRKVDAISAALGARRAHVASLVRQQPALAAARVEVLAARVRRLADALCVPPVQALVMAARDPAVVAANPAELRRRAERLAAALGLPAEQGMFLAARQPAILEYSPSSVASDCARLGASLGATPAGVLQLLCRVGARELRLLLGASGGMLREQLIDVLEALGLPASSTRELDTLRMVAKCPGLLVAPPARVAESCEALVSAFQAAPAAFVHVLNRCPSLLTYEPVDILANYRGIGRLLGLPPPALARLLAAQPRLLRCRPEDVQAKLEALIYDLYMPREQVRARRRVGLETGCGGDND